MLDVKLPPLNVRAKRLERLAIVKCAENRRVDLLVYGQHRQYTAAEKIAIPLHECGCCETISKSAEFTRIQQSRYSASLWGDAKWRHLKADAANHGTGRGRQKPSIKEMHFPGTRGPASVRAKPQIRGVSAGERQQKARGRRIFCRSLRTSAIARHLVLVLFRTSTGSSPSARTV